MQENWAKLIGTLAISERVGGRHHRREIAILSGFGKMQEY